MSNIIVMDTVSGAMQEFTSSAAYKSEKESLLHEVRKEKMIQTVQSFTSPVNMLEIGTWYGTGSTRLWLDLLHEGSSLTLMDLWRPFSNDSSECTEIRGDDTKAYQGWISTIEQVQLFESAKRKNITINVIRGDSKPLLENFQSELFDFIYIDGDHRYDGCYYDMIQAKRLIKSNGIICGDDHETIPTAENVEEYRKTMNDITRPYHPGVGVAVYDAFGKVNTHNGFWWINVKDGELVL